MATKRLARQLGLIRRKSVASASGDPGRSRFKQVYDYLIVIDFESTCWKDGKQHNSPEIIEFPAVLLNTTTGEIESEFHAYVQPQEHPILSEFCTELTGIKQVQVDEGVPLKICLSQFCKWIHKIQQQKKIIFTTGDSEPSPEVKLCAFVTWSDWDLGVCLEYECRRKQLLKPVFLNSWIDLRATYKLFYKRKPKGLNGALQEVGIEFSGREHSGLDDSRNTALLAWKMMKDGCLMTITRSLNKVLTKKNPKIFVRSLDTDQVEETSACNISIQGPSIYQKEPKSTADTQEKAQMNLASVNSSIKDQLQLKTNTTADADNIKRCFPLLTTKPSASVEQLCSPRLNPPLNMQKQRKSEQLALNDKSQSSALKSNLVLVATTIPSVNVVSDGEVGCTFDCLPMLADWEEVALLPASQAEQDADCVPPISDTNVDTSFNSGERSMVLREPEILSYENSEDFKETPQKFETSKSIVYKSPHSTVYKVKGVKHPGLDASAFKLPECKPFTFSSLNAKSLHSSVLRKQPLLGVTKRNSSSPLAFPQAKKQTFTVHEEKSASSFCSPGTSSRKVLPSVLTSTVNLQEPWGCGKMTPPLCKCGRRSKRLIVSNNGPNHGKAFYCCPSGKYQQDRKCCGYFKWELTLQKERANSKALSHSSEGLTFSSPESRHTCDRNLSIPIKNSLRLRPSMRN